MKRPLAIYFVAFWCLIALFAQVGFAEDFLKESLSDMNIPAEYWKLAVTVSGILVIWHTVRLVQLKAFERSFAIVYLSWWTLVLAWRFSIIIGNPQSPLRFYIGVPTMVVLNFASTWFLGRRSFNQFAHEFSAQREQENYSNSMKKVSQERILADIKKSK